MSSFQNVNLKQYFKRYGIKYGINRLFFISRRLHFVHDNECRKTLYYSKTSKLIKRKYYKFKDQDPQNIFYHSDGDYEDCVWVYWKQGLESAPDIVKACINSIKKYCEKVIVISDKNMNKYVEFPDSILDKVNKGNISAAAFSDLLRLCLLEHYGGTWIDATVLLTGKIPNYILDSDFFTFQESFGRINNPALYTSWFIHAKKGNDIIRQSKNIFFEYWEKENHIIEYLLIYIIFTIIVENEQYQMPLELLDYTQLLLKNLDKDFNLKDYNFITQKSTIHKLSYKLSNSVYENKNSFYYKVIEGEI